MENYKSQSRREFLSRALLIGVATAAGTMGALEVGFSLDLSGCNSQDQKPTFVNPYEPLTSLDRKVDIESNRMPIPTVILFTAPYCGPCKPLNEAYNSVSGLYDNDKVFLTICDITENPEIGQEYVGGITPRMIIKNGGNQVKLTGGILTEEIARKPKLERPQAMKSVIDEYLAQVE